MTKSNYTKRRRLIQGLAVIVLLSVPLRFFCFDLESECMRVFGARFGLATMFYPLFAMVGLLLFVVVSGMRKGRLFCSHICPMHMFLEVTNVKQGKGRIRTGLWSILFSVLLSQVVLSFFLPLRLQWSSLLEGKWTLAGVGLALFVGFVALFAGYRDRFCKKGCPYALIQMLLQSDRTRVMRFSNPDRTCTNCKGCDDICPMVLRPRFESATPDCTNCNLCHDACSSELGAQGSLFAFVDPDPDAS